MKRQSYPGRPNTESQTPLPRRLCLSRFNAGLILVRMTSRDLKMITRGVSPAGAILIRDELCLRARLRLALPDSPTSSVRASAVRSCTDPTLPPGASAIACAPTATDQG